MIRFNWQKIVGKTKGDREKILEYFYNIYLSNNFSEYLEKNKFAREIYFEQSKMSFLLNIKDLLENSLNATKEEQYVYLDLASRRSLFNYFNTNKKVDYLQKWKVIDYDLDKLKLNRLLLLDDNNIYFIYEGV